MPFEITGLPGRRRLADTSASRLMGERGRIFGREAERRAWATVNKRDGGGKRSRSGRASRKSASRKTTASRWRRSR